MQRTLLVYRMAALFHHCAAPDPTHDQDTGIHQPALARRYALTHRLRERHQLAACYLHHRVGGQLATEIDVQVGLIEGLDGNGVGVLPCNHLQHHLVAAHMGQAPHCADCLHSDLQAAPGGLTWGCAWGKGGGLGGAASVLVLLLARLIGDVHSAAPTRLCSNVGHYLLAGCRWQQRHGVC